MAAIDGLWHTTSSSKRLRTVEAGGFCAKPLALRAENAQPAEQNTSNGQHTQRRWERYPRGSLRVSHRVRGSVLCWLPSRATSQQSTCTHTTSSTPDIDPTAGETNERLCTAYGGRRADECAVVIVAWTTTSMSHPSVAAESQQQQQSPRAIKCLSMRRTGQVSHIQQCACCCHISEAQSGLGTFGTTCWLYLVQRI